MSPPLRTTLAVLVGLALLVAPTGAAQEPPPDEVAPPPAPPAATTPDPEPPVEIEAPPTVTIRVPPLPEAKPAPKAPATKQVEPTRREPVRRSSPNPSPSRSVPVSEPVSSFESDAPAAEAPPAKSKPAKKKPAKTKVQRPRPRVVAKATAPVVRTIRDPDRAGAVLAAQFTLGDGSESAGVSTTIIALAIMLALLLGGVVGVVGAAPVLAERWPKVFVPVIESTERIVLAGVCLAGAALTLAVTWALTGPGS